MLKTRQKILLASMLSSLVCRLRALAGKGSETEIERRGIRWRVDLGEGIDFAIFLFGAFELRTLRAYWPLIQPGDVVLDIGANIGAHTLPFAQRTGERGKVVAFEPTSYAHAKLAKNLSLNPWARDRVVLEQVMLVGREDSSPVPKVPASWPLHGGGQARQADHGGVFMETAGARFLTLDTYLGEAGVAKVDFIKLDVDGNEWQVVDGADAVLRRDRPVVLIEIAPHGYDQTVEAFDQMLDRFASLGYRLEDVNSGRPFPLDGEALRRAIPVGSSRNMFLFSEGRGQR
jgi:FkbM family methyltransferase